MLHRLTLLFLLLATLPAHAVIVRGRVTSPLGQPLPGSRVQLILLTGGPRNAAGTVTGIDGAFELRTDLSGRFLLITSPSTNAPQFAPQVGDPFYGGRSDLLTQDVALNAIVITPERSTLDDLPLRQLSDPPLQIPADHLLTLATLAPELRPTPAVFLVELGQTGSPLTLYLRGAPVTSVLIDNVSAESLGGPFNLAPVTSSGLAAFSSSPAAELSATPNPAVDTQSGILSLTTPAATSLHPVLIYSADAGTLSSLRNEAILTATHTRADALLSFARFNTDNDLPAIRLHLITSAANLGYHVSANTSLRVTLRDDISSTPLPSPFDFFALTPATKLAAQNLYASATFETRTARAWHNLLRYGLARTRAQAFNFATPITGLPVTIHGANGFTASGTATFLPVPAREDTVTNRDEATLQTDAPIKPWLSALLTTRFEDERAADLTPTTQPRLERTHFSAALLLRGDIHHRLFYETSGNLDHSSLLGATGSPRLGLTYAPVRPGLRRFRGTSLRLTAATGLREPTLLEQTLPNPTSPRSRTFDLSLDQSITSRLTLRTTYFHSQFSHQSETLTLAPLTLSNALAFRAHGLSSELRFQPTSRLLLHGSYTYLAALVERTAATPTVNPTLPNIPIGAATALAGARPFHRPPRTGFLAAQYTGTVFAATLRATLAGRSDDSTNLVLNPQLLLPNRDLSPGYASVDASFTYNLTHAFTLFAQFDNLLNDRHLAPIGFLSTPFQVRTGLRIRLGHE